MKFFFLVQCILSQKHVLGICICFYLMGDKTRRQILPDKKTIQSEKNVVLDQKNEIISGK